ncbi:hypothetical protein CEXT_39251 [Caerostris extrusa]|uniref:Uncharacterized protein n=1 Tax=Caerostris extrusa TaxID=172846 RepID=A0AAV4VI59_CAEEX|nr:hypothetical protein CEXT_39251 [Caerostris extrusa]
MSFEEDLKKFVHMTAFFMGVKIMMDCFDVGIFDAGVALIVGIVINRVLVYNWTNLLEIWKPIILGQRNRSPGDTSLKKTHRDFYLLGDVETKSLAPN